MKLTLSEIIEQFEDAFILQPMNELEIYRRWIPKLRQAYDGTSGRRRYYQCPRCGDHYHIGNKGCYLCDHMDKEVIKMEKITAYKVSGVLYETSEEADYAELKKSFKPIFKEIEYKFKGVNAFFKFFEDNFLLIEKMYILYITIKKREFGKDWRDFV